MRASFAVLAFASCAAVAPSLAHADGLNLSATASTPNPGTLASQADLAAQTDALQTRLQIGLQSGQAAPAAGPLAPAGGWWDSGSANLSATWTPAPLAKVELGAQNSLRYEAAAGAPVFIDGVQTYVESRQSLVQGALTLTPASPLNLKVGASASTNSVENAQVSGQGGVSSDILVTQAQQMSTQMEWKPVSLVALDAGGKVESTGVYWGGARAGSYAAVDPSLGATLKPWAGASWRFTLDREASPLTTDQFVGYGVGVPVGLVNLQPNREWRYQAAIEQKAGAIDLTASVLQARLETYAYVAPYGVMAGRVDAGAGDRSEVQAGLAAPLPILGLAPFTLKASGAWRTSQVQDPITGQTGRLSGETPYDASLSLSQTLAAGGMSWGVTARASGPARSYLASQVTTLSATAGLGGFLQYRPGLVTVQLQLDNLLGGDRLQQDVYYAGPRDLSAIDHIDAFRTTDRAIRLSLSRPL